MSYKTRSKVVENVATGEFPTSTTSNPTQWARNRIAERTTKVSKIPLFYREALRYIISELGSLTYINSETDLVSVKWI